MTDIIESLNWRYATKRFDASKKLSDNDLETLKNAVGLTPSSYGLQHYKVLLISDQVIKDQLMAASYNQTQVRDASHIFVFCNRTSITENEIDIYIQRIANTRQQEISELDAFSNGLKSDLLNRSEDAISKWATNQCYIMLGNLLTTCAQLNIDSCPMEGFVPTEFNKILDLNDKGLNACVVAPVGYRHEEDVFQNFAKVRKAHEELYIQY